MVFNDHTVDIIKIDTNDQTFRISSGNNLPHIAQSIQTVGLINPPIVLRKNGKFSIISGFSRIEALTGLNCKSIPVRELPQDSSFETCCRLSIIDNLMQRPLSLLEQSRAVALLSKTENDLQRMVSAAQAIGLHVNKDLCEKLLLISDMADNLKKAIAIDAIALPIAIRIHEMGDHQLISELTGIMVLLKLSLNRQRELLDWLEAIAMREGLSVIEVLKSKHVVQMMTDPALDHKRRVSELRAYLKKRRFPTISTMEKCFFDHLKELPLPDGATITPPPGFENDQYVLHFSFKATHDLVLLRNKLQPLIDSPELEKMLNPFE